MGTPAFAVGILAAIVESAHKVVAVVTAADKPAGRGKKIKQSDVKIFSEANHLRVFQPESLKNEVFLEDLRSLQADLFVVVAFRMLPKVIWTIPPKGTINLHASLLPALRGAAPINWAIIKGQNETGVTTFFINDVIDTGKIIDQRKVVIGENMTSGELHDQLKELGAGLTLETINKISINQTHTIDQTNHNSSDAPKIFKKDCEINWKKSAIEIHNHIRGLSPYPTAWCNLHNIKKGEQLQFKFFSSKLTEEKIPSINLGLFQGTDGILFPCADGAISIQELQVEGRTRMNYKAFLAGNDISDWRIIDN
jgi:methionyl-tRNA formyltransferase